jgi:hypothetical protein
LAAALLAFKKERERVTQRECTGAKDKNESHGERELVLKIFVL